MNFFFSIVIPTYNSEKTILKCIDSCINQTYKDFEILVVDDCSTDNTVSLVKEYIEKNKLEKISIHTLDINSGAATARNKAISLANYDFIALLDSDDYFHPMKLEIINQQLHLYSNIDLIAHNHYVENEIDNSNIFLGSSEIKPKKVDCKRLLLKNFAVTPSVVFKKSISLRFNEEMRYTEDHDFFVRVCLNNYEMYYLDLKLVGLGRPALTAGGLSSNNFRMRLGEIKMYMNLYKISYMYALLSPFLIIFSISKHILKTVQKIFK